MRKKGDQKWEQNSEGLKTLGDKWPSSFVARQEAKRFSGGIISEKSLANLDCKGEGPKGRFSIGKKSLIRLSPYCMAGKPGHPAELIMEAAHLTDLDEIGVLTEAAIESERDGINRTPRRSKLRRRQWTVKT